MQVLVITQRSPIFPEDMLWAMVSAAFLCCCRCGRGVSKSQKQNAVPLSPYSRMFPSSVQFSRSVVTDSLRPHGLQPTGLLRPWDFPGKNTRVGCHFLLQGNFPTQRSNPGLPRCRQTLYCLSHKGSPNKCQIKSVAQSCPTLCDPMNRSTPGLPGKSQKCYSTMASPLGKHRYCYVS